MFNGGIIRVAIACHDAQGDPDIYFCKMNIDKSEYESGEHYDKAIEQAEDEAYEGPFVVFDEYNSGAGHAIMTLCDWGTIPDPV